MRGLQAWVTSVVEDKDVDKVLVLARSLREATTTKHLVLLASPTLESQKKNALARAFDQVFSLDYHAVNGWIGLKDYAKLSAFNLTLFRKCVYLSPETLVVKNCDEIFDSCGNDFAAVVREDGVDTSVFCYVPSNSVFENLVTVGKKNHEMTKGQEPFNAYMKNWLVNQKQFGKLNEKYNFLMGSNSAPERDCAIVQLPRDFSVGRSSSRFEGLLESTITKYWCKLRDACVGPKITKDAAIEYGMQVSESGDHPQTSFDPTDSIAIVGISCRHPGANNFDDFWKLLISGREGTRLVPTDRWTKEHGSKGDASCQNTTGGFLDVPIDEFDNKLFGISPKEMEFLDPQQRLLLEVTWEALENASIDPLSLGKTHTGVFVGAWMNNYKDLLETSGYEEFYRMYMGNSFGAAAARISFFLRLTGPSVATESGCSSSLVAVDLACSSLRKGETSLALACGVNLLLCPFNKDTMSFVIAADGRCKTFDESADGFARAEGCGVLVLKRYADAVKDGDNICALIRGSSCVQEGMSRSMGTPTKECEALAMTLALRDARVRSNDVSYIEAHGTGTSLGDPLEVSAISEVYGRERTEPLIIGSCKTNIGHTESCSGITGIIKVVASLQNEMIPPHLHLKTLNPKIDLDEIPAKIPLEALAWPRNKNGKPRFAGVSSFGITGTDGHLILQDAPEYSRKSVMTLEEYERPIHIMKLSAKSEDALDAMLSQYEIFLGSEAQRNEHKFSDIAHTANVGRASFNHRLVIIAKDCEEAHRIIQSKKYQRNDESDSQPGKLCFLFTGQGSQYAGMAKPLYEHSPVFRAELDRCHQILAEKFQLDMKEALFGLNSASLLTRSLYSQTAIFCVEYCLLKLWESWGIKPDYVIGHSLGEFGAAVAANILSLADAIKLVAERSRLVDSLPKGKMLVLRASKSLVKGILKEYASSNSNFWLDFAAVNSNEQTVLAGDIDAVERFASHCSEKKGLKTHVLDASHAFHSRHMDPILENYRKIVETVRKSTLEGAKCGYISGVYGKIIEDDTSLSSQYWIDHTRGMVNFTGACGTAMSEGCKYFLEIGPQPILSALMMQNSRDEILTCLPSLRRSEDNWRTMLTNLGKLYLMGWPVDWKDFDCYYSRSKLRVLPTYPFQRKKYWFDALNMGGSKGLLNSSTLHPLLGSIFPNASGAKIFQNAIDLKKVEYIKDHCVGKRIIFPAAAFLEVCLAAGHCATEGLIDTFCKPYGPLTIENLKINSPLALDEKPLSQLQVVIDPRSDEANDNNTGTKIGIFRQQIIEGEAPKWTQHVVSYFTPAPVEFNEITFRDTFNLAQIKESCQVEAPVSDLYAKLDELGLKFGAHFQSLENVWKGEEGLLASVKVPSDFKEYIVHPVVLDAMLQTAMIVQSKGDEMEKLHVPIGIRKFTWLDNTESDKFYIYSCFETSGDSSGTENEVLSVLFDEQGKIIGFMSGMEFVETSVQAMESLLESQETELPPLQHEIWKPQLGQNQSRVEIWEVFERNVFSGEARKYFEGSNELSSEAREKEHLFETLSYAYFVNAYAELGWKPSVGETYVLDKLMADLQIQPQYRKLLRFHMTVFQRDGLLTFLSDNEIQITKLPPSVLETHQMIQSTRKELETYNNVQSSIHMYVSCGIKFAPILQGKESALSILFPEDRSKPSLDQFYTEAYSFSGMNQKIINHFEYLLVENTSTQHKGIFRVLEVGAGTGNFTGGILQLFKDRDLELEYTFTDISPAFFINAQKKFEEYKDCVKYQVLNVEEDVKTQGFSPGYFDLIIGADVIHATRDLTESLTNLRQLLRPSGLLCLIEGAKANHITSIFGLLNGYWRFVDTDIRQHHPLVSGKTWEKVCLNSGFDSAVAIPLAGDFYAFVVARASEQYIKVDRPMTYSKSGKWVIFHNMDPTSDHLLKKLSLYKETVQVWKSSKFVQSEDGACIGINVNEKEHMTKLLSTVRGQSSASQIEGVVYLWGLAGGKVEQEEISQPLLYLLQSIAELTHQALPKVFIVTRGIFPIGDHLCEHPAASTLTGIAKSSSNELNSTRMKVVDICPDEDPHQSAQDLFFELWNEDPDKLLAYRKKVRYFGKIVKTKLSEKTLKLPQCERFQLVLPQTKAISDLKFGTLGKFSLKPDEIEVKVKAAALNFRDVFAVMKPDAQFEKINVVGSDFTGVVSSVGSAVTKWKAGDSVLGCNLEDGALPSHVRIVEDAVIKMPSNFTFAEAATLPAVFATAYYSLVTVAKMKPGETVLIHTASGGVGLSAIQIAQQIGANIIATAGSTRKRAYLKNLGVEHVFHSRNTNYELDIMTATGGKGVDIVLNSLTGPGFKEASLNVCKTNARFIEMSKLTIWQPEEVKKLRRDVEYTVVDLTSVSRDVWHMLFSTLDKFLHNGLVKPIPYVRFDGVLIREALTHLQKAKHIGKIVCIMPDIKFQAGHFTAHTPLFNDQSTYLITGGLGGIGLEVVKWMASEGAANLIIASRSQPKENHLQILRSLRSENKNIITKAVDVGDYAACKALIHYIKDPASNLPPLRGVMHCAGVLSDGTLINQSWEKFLSTFRPKVKGSWNLHLLTKDCNLEHFILFSSMASLLGPPGQSNHAAGNAYMDALAHHRDTTGLPAMTINWGQWGQVGVAAGKELRGVLPFSPQRGIATLEAAMKSQRTQLAVVNLDFSVLVKAFPQSKVYFQNMLAASSTSAGSHAIKSEKFWEEVETAKEGDKGSVIKKYIKVLLRQILKLDDEEPIDDQSNLQDMGLDSLMMIELKNNLQTVLGSRMSIGTSALADCHNIEALAERLLNQMNDYGSESDSDKSPTSKLDPEEMRKLIEEDSKLPESTRAVEGVPLNKLSDAKTFLLTGLTGNLGPYILRELLKQSQVETVFCLMRKSSNPLAKLVTILKESNLEAEVDMSRVKIVVGNLAYPKLGLEDVEYEALSRQVDAVIHCAVKSNHVETYGVNEMRRVNVIGTLNILEFACQQKTKHVFHSSSLVAVSSTNEDGCLSEDWPKEDELNGITDLGYPISKMICDRLVHQATQRGIPCKSFRFAGLIGNSETGRSRLHNSHIMLRFLCYLKLGAMPSMPIPAFLIPVDIAASTSLKIFFDGSTAQLSDIYNLCHPNPALEQEFPVLAKEFGYEVDVVDYGEFVNRFANEGEDSPLYPFKELYENEERYNSLCTFPDAVRKWLENPDGFFSVKKVSKVLPEYSSSLQSTWNYIRRDLEFVRDQGLFEKFKLTK